MMPADQREKTPVSGFNLSSSRDPSHERSRQGAHGKRRRNSERKVLLHATCGLIQEFFSGVATLLRGMFYTSHAIPYRIGNRARRARSVASRFGDVVSRPLDYIL
jgi:hypothetical protein